MQMHKSYPVVAIVGRPNVGKSSLFNAILGRRHAIVHSESGVTRDRIVADANWKGFHFKVIDTGGLCSLEGEKRRVKESDEAVRKQAAVAIESADILLFTVEIGAGVTVMDSEISNLLRKSGKRVLLILNKSDNERTDGLSANFARLGWKDVLPVSCMHRRGIDALLDFVAEALGGANEPPPEPALKLAVVGRPNVGKSSIVNRLLGEDRMIVSDVPGTTRDAVDVEFEIRHGGETLRTILIDTAGMRQRRKADTSVEVFSVMRAERSIGRADIILFVIDASLLSSTSQDRTIAKIIGDSGKGCIILANKTDICKGIGLKEIRDEIGRTLPFMNYAPVIACSALTGSGFNMIPEKIARIAEDMRTNVPTSVINRIIQDAFERSTPASTGKKFFKVYYSTMTEQMPPRFIMFVNDPALCPGNYLGYLKNHIRKSLGVTGFPIRIEMRKRERK